jgi:hypothetical protein
MIRPADRTDIDSSQTFEHGELPHESAGKFITKNYIIDVEGMKKFFQAWAY